MNKKLSIISIIGKPNVGKSTLFNKLINKKISITSKKKNTTQKSLIGIKNKKNKQFIYIDNPGWNNINIIKYLKNIIKYIKLNLLNNNINLFIIIIEKQLNFNEIKIIKFIKKIKIPLLILINKIDKLKNKSLLLNIIQQIKNFKINNIIPTNLKKKKYLNIINKTINKFLINKNHLFKKNILTNKTDKYIIKEILREKIFRLMGDEIPYNLKFKINNLYKKNNILYIEFYLITFKKQYIKILIGKNGNKINKIIYLSKKSIKKYFNYKYIPKLIIKIKYIKKLK